MDRTDRVATELARRQCGAFGGWQLDAAGVPDRIRHRRVASGAWLRPHPAVYVMPSVAPSYDQRLWIGWLAVGAHAIVSHEAAAQVRTIPNVVRD